MSRGYLKLHLPFRDQEATIEATEANILMIVKGKDQQGLSTWQNHWATSLALACPSPDFLLCESNKFLFVWARMIPVFCDKQPKAVPPTEQIPELHNFLERPLCFGVWNWYPHFLLPSSHSISLLVNLFYTKRSKLTFCICVHVYINIYEYTYIYIYVVFCEHYVFKWHVHRVHRRKLHRPIPPQK